MLENGRPPAWIRMFTTWYGADLKAGLLHRWFQKEKKRKSLSKLTQRLLPHPPVRPTDSAPKRRNKSGWKERLKGLFIAKVSPAGNRRNGGYIRPLP